MLVGGVEKWTTTTTYTGDSTATTAVQGGTAGRTIVDARGRTVETREYAGTSPTDTQYGATLGTAYTSTKFEYTLDSKQTKITGPDSATWSYTYDQYGRQKTASDPDKGTAESEYDLLDRVTKTVTAYDTLSRPTTTELTLPAADSLYSSVPNGKLTFTSTYRPDGTVGSSSEPALGGLPSETIEYRYGAVGRLTSMMGLTGYLQNADYWALGQVKQLVLGKGGPDDRSASPTTVTVVWRRRGPPRRRTARTPAPRARSAARLRTGRRTRTTRAASASWRRSTRQVGTPRPRTATTPPSSRTHCPPSSSPSAT
ncbi:hypothetical protein [Streptomyces sp. NPDC048623]|uniref:hypothetical protein n=1 Tax=Streptomyces sp. NPDC048623 TaxID=3155761 RepID=UPI003443E6BB